MSPRAGHTPPFFRSVLLLSLSMIPPILRDTADARKGPTKERAKGRCFLGGQLSKANNLNQTMSLTITLLALLARHPLETTEAGCSSSTRPLCRRFSDMYIDSKRQGKGSHGDGCAGALWFVCAFGCVKMISKPTIPWCEYFTYAAT